MENQSVIHNWATALSEIARETNKLDVYIDNLKDLLNLFENNYEFEKFFSNSFINEKDRELIIDKTLKDSFDINIVNAIKLMIKRKVFGSIQPIFKYALKQIWEYKKIEHGIIYSSFELPSNTISMIEKKLSSKLGKTVNFENIIDKDIIAGIVVEVANKSYDFSVKGKIEDMKVKIKENRN
ncbi:F0F1 ATP synthase subunit delta [Spiroplasma turonicum]|uniref:ATP synthase subunit delta n=1 Tax=Spiroplasma turonicum TaxID=216946 RepID=A0A0K1P553_9MOLU|nr:F0F1 ATP synthase subunit delta [Spiroplasma turonicum]AKU79294.1 F0F1 ATP synthase subunit delta [Spiroplasma turonicum]ALX70317.1 F0F1 ATP synthase subunit delta [Spiroplasma turonicum]